MALVVFGEKVDMLNIPSPEPGGFLVAYDLDGILKQKDENGIISVIGGGNSALSDVLSLGNNTGTYSIILDSSILSGNNKISLNNSAISLTTDNGLYNESYLFMNSESLLLSNGSKSFRIEKDIYDNYNVITRYDIYNEQIIKENSYKLSLNNKPVFEFTNGTTSTIGGSRLSSLISSDGSTISPGVINTVVLGGLGINAIQSNSVYVPDLYIQDNRSIKGTNGNAKIQFTQYNDIVSSNNNNILGILSSTSSVTLSSNGILLRDTLNSTSSPNIDAGVSYISTKNSTTSTGVVNTVVIGGEGLSATESNTVYLGNDVNINNQYTLPNVDGLDGQVLKTDGLGNTSWDYTILTLNTISMTASAFKLLNGVFDLDTTYIITDADVNLYGGTEIYLTTNSYGILNETGIGKFYNPEYDQLISGFKIWDILNSYSIGNTVVWGGYYWNNISGLVGTAIDIYTLSSDWTKETYLPYYLTSYDIIKYDWMNDLITYRNEKNTNIVSTNVADILYWSSINVLYNPIKSFQWGNVYDIVTDKGIGSQNIINSYNQNINFKGSKQTNVTFNNKSYQINSIFESGSYQNNIIFDNSYQDAIQFSNGSYQENLIFSNSYQKSLMASTSLSQVNLLFENNKSDRISTPLTLNENGLFIGSDVTIDGKLTVFGTASIINSENLLVQDPIILLSGTQSGIPTLDSGIFINRGTSVTEAFIWDESMGEFSFISTNDNSTVIGDVNILDYSNIKANNAIMIGTVSSTAFKLFSGTNLQFLKGDGTVDTNTYTPTGRTITINGTSYDLSSDRTWNVGTLTGSGTTGYIPKFTGSTVIGNSAIYDNGSTITISSTVTANSFIKSGGTSSQFLKADGSVDSNVYAIDSNVIHKTGDETKTGKLTLSNTSGSGLYVNNTTSTSGAYINNVSFGQGLYVNNQNAGSGITISQVLASTGIGLNVNFSKGSGIKVQNNLDGNSILLVNTNLTTGTTIKVTNGNSTTCNTMTLENSFGVILYRLDNVGNIYGGSFVKNGGTSSQFLKADGSVDSNLYQIAGGYVPYTGATASVSLSTYSITAGNFILNNTAGGLYYGSAEKRVTVANYVSGGIVRIETNGGQAAATFESNLDFIPYGNVAIGLTAATSKLHVFGASGSFTYQDTTQASGYILTSDSNGVAKWTDPNPQMTITSNTTLDDTYNNAIVKIKTSANITIPSTLMTNFNCVFRTFSGATASFIAGSGTTMDAPYGMTLSTHKMATLFKDGSTTTYILEGELTI